MNVDYLSTNKVIGKFCLPLLKMQVKIWEINKYELRNWEIWELIRTNAFVVAGQWAPQWMQIASIHSTQHYHHQHHHSMQVQIISKIKLTICAFVLKIVCSPLSWSERSRSCSAILLRKFTGPKVWAVCCWSARGIMIIMMTMLWICGWRWWGWWYGAILRF